MGSRLIPEVLQSKKKMPVEGLNPEFFGPVVQKRSRHIWIERWLCPEHRLIQLGALEQKRSIRQSPASNGACSLLQPHVARVTRERFLMAMPADRFDAGVIQFPSTRRSGDLEVVLNPFWIRGKTGATRHTTYLLRQPHSIHHGPGIRPEHLRQRSRAEYCPPFDGDFGGRRDAVWFYWPGADRNHYACSRRSDIDTALNVRGVFQIN